MMGDAVRGIGGIGYGTGEEIKLNTDRVIIG